MFRRLNVLVGIGLAAAGMPACSNSNPAAPDANLIVNEIPIDSVDVRVLESSPPQAVAHVEGILGDGCSKLRSESQARLGNLVLVTILRERPRDAVCSQIARLYSADIILKGEYPPGRYLLRVNEAEKAFSTE
jgi:hypothetical protein